jgi:hypothetical protein
MARTCVVLEAWHTIKKSAAASSILRKSKLTICSPFLSKMALMMVLRILELLVNRVIVLFGRFFNTERGSNNTVI